MIHPLFRLLATQPEVLAEHLGAYAQLASAEVSEAALAVRARAVFMMAMVLFILLGLGLGGVALLLLAALPISVMPAPWLLAVVPLTPLALAVGCWAALQQRPLARSFAQLREQMAADAALLREAGQR
ncbi:hypothetical protein [Aquabacterium sp.]|uniref:hypothetical protein n=1 Tax=Aquabacterium sp. TaxID=1872578 RepID=UPI002CBD714E|nr:hypothetical protein [Aquabacterium sp.]HSW04630.1 hypothetical protein [Aquabacterium sp.]